METTSAIENIQDLVQYFEDHKESFMLPSFNEATAREQLINPFFEALGWDVTNRDHYAEAYKDVVHEDAINVGGATKAPDYSFRIGGARKFFVEAKKPSVNIKDDPAPAFQLRRYAWSAKLPLSILTNFREFAVYDCRVKPSHKDKPSEGRVLYLTFNEYEKKWEEIESVWSKAAVLRGSFDKYAVAGKGKRGTAEVDDDFLKLIERWRSDLAKHLALRNAKLTQRELNFAVQRIIDRIIFLRICEDRGIEPAERLRGLTNGKRIYERLVQFFHQADDKYNSGLFHFQKDKDRPEEPDELTPDLKLEDSVLSGIIGDLYFPSPYVFDVIPADILGQVYEQFLGKVIRLTAGHQAKVEDKPEVKKAGGVYYTPTYIVEYIVKNTVGKLLEDKTPKEVAKLRILDPACGSGSFLLGAYQYLLDWHRDWYAANDPEDWAKKKNAPIYLTGFPLPEGEGKRMSNIRAGEGEKPKSQTGVWKLTTAKRKEILLNNIHGVDIDAQAVETTKLSLLLKVLEGESQQSLAQQFKMFHERALPDLDKNIKCGNSLIGPDFYESGALNLFGDDELRYHVNAFDWNTQFADIMKAGGFDAVIGNPPYGALITEQEGNYLFKKNTLQQYQLDSYLLFLERSLSLTKTKGLIGMIIPNTWLLNILSPHIRKEIFNKSKIETIAHYQFYVFKNATVNTEVVIFKNSPPEGNHPIEIELVNKNGSAEKYSIAQTRWQEKNGAPVNILERPEYISLADKIERFTKLDDLYLVTQGSKPFQVGKGKPPQTRKIVEEKPYVSDKKKNKTFRPLLRGSLINKYEIFWDEDYWISLGDWLAEPRYSANYDAKEKIVIRQTGDSLIATLDQKQFVVRDNLYTIVGRNNQNNLHVLLGLLNSKLLNWFYQNILNPEKGEALAQVKRGHIAQLPIPPADKARHDRMVQLVDQMLALHKQLGAATPSGSPLLRGRKGIGRTPDEKTRLQREIETTDNMIDKLVYELYGLTEEEIKIVNDK